MIRLKITKRYHDIELDRRVSVGETVEVNEERARKLLSMGLAEVLSIPKLKVRKNEKARSNKKR